MVRWSSSARAVEMSGHDAAHKKERQLSRLALAYSTIFERRGQEGPGGGMIFHSFADSQEPLLTLDRVQAGDLLDQVAVVLHVAGRTLEAGDPALEDSSHAHFPLRGFRE
jgi:hypothetical protein